VSISQTVTQAWLRRGPLACALWPLSALMAALVALRRSGFAAGWLTSHALPVPVLVVGNRVAGGAGKTPTTIALLQHLRAKGWRPGVLSRGYKAEASAITPLLIDEGSAATLDARATGDEPLLIWRRTGAPIMVGRDRVASGHALLLAHPELDILVCDDGLQHLKLQRDLEVIVFDERGAGNGWLLPAGPLREPIDAPAPATLKHPPLVLYNAERASTPLTGFLAKRGTAPLTRLEDWWLGRPASPGTAAHLAPDATWAMAGIARPQRFFDALASQGIQAHSLPLPDHADLAEMPWPPEARDVIVTEKDAVKLPPERVAAQRPNSQVWVAALDFRPETAFWTALDAALATLPARPAAPAPH
jgi:tetraacyldisaccharide 4'-kinase